MNEMPLIDAAKANVLSLPDETQFAANGIVSRTVLRTPTTRVVLFGFAEGQELSEHTSTAEALIQVLSGRCEFSLDGKPHLLKAGDLLHMPPNLPHAVKATEKFSMLLTLLKPAEPPLFLNGVKGAVDATKKALAPAPSSCKCATARDVDARGLEPPQPMVVILEALASLPEGGELRARTDRRPLHLYAQLEERGCTGETKEQDDGSFVTTIRRA